MRLLLSLFLLAGLSADFLIAQPAEAARAGGGFSGRASSFGRASATASRPSVKAAAAAAPSSSRYSGSGSSGTSASSSASPSSSVGSSWRGRTARTPSKPLLQQAPPPPSQHLTQVIRERESSSGLGWFVGGMALYSILHSDDSLSAADRSWIEARIREEQGDDAGEAPVEMAQPAEVSFAYTLPDQFLVGRDYLLTATATSRAGTPLPVECELPGAVTSRDGTSASVQWTPRAPGTQVLTCKSQGSVDQRLFQIETADADAQARNDRPGVRPAAPSAETPDAGNR